MGSAAENLDAFESEVEENNAEVEGEVETEAERKSQEQAEEEAARAGAIMAVAFAETMVKMKWDYVTIDKEVKAELVAKATPVVKKYGTELPKWLLPYQAEIELGITIAVAGFSILMQVDAYEKHQSEQGEGDEVSAGQPEHSPTQ